MFSIIIDLIKTGIGFFQNKNKTQADAVQENTESANETNREEIKAGRGWRSFLGYVCTFILAYNYIVVPILDYFGIVLFSFPLSDIIRIIILLVSGN